MSWHWVLMKMGIQTQAGGNVGVISSGLQVHEPEPTKWDVES